MIQIYYDKNCDFCTGIIHAMHGLKKQRGIKLMDVHDYQPEMKREIPDSLIIVKPNEILTYSDAALEVMILSGGFVRFLGNTARLIPLKLRDSVYRIVARNRFGLFRRIACRLI
jgi:predicted DCC family thiol-disulfide oxidoreductase YuxK